VSSLDRSFPLISVVIPNYNYAQYLGNAIESVLNQSYKNIQLIVVDNASTDSSSIVASKYGNSVNFVKKNHGGVSSARNLGLSMAEGNFVCFLDSDDTWSPTKLEKQLEIAIRTEADIVYSGISETDSSLRVTRHIKPEYRGDCNPYYFKFPTKAIVLLGCSNALIKREVIADIEFKEYLHTSADWDFFRRICKGAKVEYVQESQVFYRRHNQSMSISDSDAKFYDDNELAIRDFIMDLGVNSRGVILIRNQYSLWFRFQLQAIKTFLRRKNFVEVGKRALKILLFVFITFKRQSASENQDPGIKRK
jgi:glycosyltransferase involved in cell wall biosynthesis